jgi:hypothetical protein
MKILKTRPLSGNRPFEPMAAERQADILHAYTIWDSQLPFWAAA